MATDPPTPEQIADSLAKGVEKAAAAQSYRLPDGTIVTRAPIGEMMDARRQAAQEAATKKRKGIFARIGFGRAS